MKTLLATGLALIALGFIIPTCHGADATNKAVLKLERPKPSKLFVAGIGTIRYDEITDGPTYGAGADVGYAFNRYVIGRVRAVAYEDWGGSVVDEGSLLVEAKLLQSANGGVSLSALGGVGRDFDREDWYMGIGARGEVKISNRVSAFADAMIRAHVKETKDLVVAAGVQVGF